jgi:hypothetical protein
VVDCDGLENRWGCKLSGGSNPSPSANFLFADKFDFFQIARKTDIELALPTARYSAVLTGVRLQPPAITHFFRCFFWGVI